MSADTSSEAENPQDTKEEQDGLYDAEGNVINWTQRYFDEGHAEGLEKGRAEGLAEGLAEGRAAGRAEERLNVLHQLLQGKFGDISEAQLASVLEHRDEPDLFTRIIKADTVDELLQSLR